MRMRYVGIETTKPLQYAVCGQLIDKDGFLHHRRTFEQHVFILVTEGILHITAAEKEYNVGENQYIFLKAGEEHFGHKASKGALSYFWVHIVDDCPVITVESMVAGCEKNEFPYFFPEFGEIVVANRTRRFFRQLVDFSLEESLYVKEMFDYTLSLLMLEVSQEFTHWQTGSEKQKIERKTLPPVIVEAREWIRENYSHPFKVTELADTLGYQADYLSTLFKQSMGISIIGYTNKIRIEAAKNLLETEGLPIKVVAYSCGFADEKYFMKVFKKMEGSTPGQYKNGC